MHNLNYTTDDLVAAAKFVREQAVRLPHAQRRAAIAMAEIYEGIDLDRGGNVAVSIPIRHKGEIIGDVAFIVQPPLADDQVPLVTPIGGYGLFREYKD